MKEERSNQLSTWSSADGDVPLCLAGEDEFVYICNNVPRMVQPLCAGCVKDELLRVHRRDTALRT